MQVRYQATVDIAAPLDRVWAVMADVEGWPRWTPTVREAEILDRPFAEGARVRLRQPRLPETVWVVTEYRPLAGFTWTASGPGIRSEGRHELRRDGDLVTAEVTLTQAGALSWLAHLLAGGLTHRYVRQEADGLKAWCETHP